MSKKTPKEPAVPGPEETKQVALPGNIDFSKDAGVGMEGTDETSFAVPFLRVLQKGSPQCDPDDARVLAGAEPGMFINTITRQLFDGKKGVILLPCAFQRRFVRWAPKGAEGSGFKGEFLPEMIVTGRESGLYKEVDGKLYVADEKGEVPNPKKADRMADVRNHFCMLWTGGDQWTPVLFSLASTQIKKSRVLMQLLSQVRIAGKIPPTWLNRVKVTTLPESNDQGKWMGVDVTLDGFLDSNVVYGMCKEFHNQIIAGKIDPIKYDEETVDGQEGKGF